MKRVCIILSCLVFLHSLRDYWLQTKKRYMGYEIVTCTIKKVLKAPVNLFFDVTPIGKIL